MTEIIAGKLHFNELSINSKGGTEQMAERIVRDVDPALLSKFHITFSRIREQTSDLIKIFYCHDLHNDPEVQRLTDPEFRKQFAKIVCVSNWQAQMYNLALGIPYSEMIVIPNGIEPIPFVDRVEEGPVRLIYHTTPHRGLGILVPVFEHLQNHFDIELDVFSSFEIYGWADRDIPYQGLFDRINNNPKMRYHGFQPNSVVREELQKSHIFAFPSIWPETSCIAAIEAMCAGCQIVHPNLAALPETTANLTFQYQYNEDHNAHAQAFAHALGSAIADISRDKTIFKNNSNFVATYANGVYNWGRISQLWNNLLRGLHHGKVEQESKSEAAS